MKYTGIILGALSSFLLLIVATYSALTLQLGLLIVFAFMFIMSAWMTKNEIDNIFKRRN